MGKRFVDDVPRCPGTPSNGAGGGWNGGGWQRPPGGDDARQIIRDTLRLGEEINNTIREINANQARLRRQSRPADPFYVITLFAGVCTAIFMASEGFPYPVSSAVFATAVVMLARWASKRC